MKREKSIVLLVFVLSWVRVKEVLVTLPCVVLCCVVFAYVRLSCVMLRYSG